MVLSMDRWKGTVAVVTGASAGCGAAIAEHLVCQGLKVVGLARRNEQVEQLSKKLKGQPGRLYAFKADVSNEDDIKAAFKWVTENLGPVHILVNNAGLAKPSSFIKGSPQAWKDVINTNLFGLAVATQEAIKNMLTNKIDGHIVNINSILGHYVAHLPDLNIYSSTKFGVTALTETLRQELNRTNSKIKITSISPGAVDTEFMMANLSDSDFEKAFSTFPKLQSEDVADAVVYVLSTPPHVQVHELTVRPIGETI